LCHIHCLLYFATRIQQCNRHEARAFILFTPLHAALQNQYLIKVAEIKKVLQLRGLSINGLKAKLQQRLQDVIDNNAAMTHTTNTAMEGTVNINDNTGNAEHAELPTEPPTHTKKTTTMTVEDVDKMKGKSSLALPASIILRKEFTNKLAIMLTFYPFHLLMSHHNSNN
jgi:hypothetical protein